MEAQKVNMPDELNQALRISAVLTMAEVHSALDAFAMYLASMRNLLNADSELVSDERKVAAAEQFFTVTVNSLERSLKRAIKNPSGL